MSDTINSIVLSKVLFELDPAHTLCVENELLDEYDLFSTIFCNKFKDLKTLPVSFENYFSTPLNSSALENIISLYQKYE